MQKVKCLECEKGLLKKTTFVDVFRDKYLMEVKGYICTNCGGKYFGEDQLNKINERIKHKENTKSVSVGNHKLVVVGGY